MAVVQKPLSALDRARVLVINALGFAAIAHVLIFIVSSPGYAILLTVGVPLEVASLYLFGIFIAAVDFSTLAVKLDRKHGLVEDAFKAWGSSNGGEVSDALEQTETTDNAIRNAVSRPVLLLLVGVSYFCALFAIAAYLGYGSMGYIGAWGVLVTFVVVDVELQLIHRIGRSPISEAIDAAAVLIFSRTGVQAVRVSEVLDISPGDT